MKKPEIQPGPCDPSVLTLQQHHRSELIWNGDQDIGPLHCRIHLKSIEGLNVHPRVLDYVKQTGFFGIHSLAFVQINRDLITALVERWRQETHTFHLSVGEATITLQDVAVLLGLKVHGEPVIGHTNYNWADLAEELLGVKPPLTHLKGSALSVPWLRERFKGFPEDADELTVQQYARIYILLLMGSVLFTDKSGNDVQLIYLPLLSDLSQVQNYSWASAALACLYRNLCRASQAKARDIAGPLLLLQLWSWEHINVGRPQIIVNSDSEHPLGHQHQLHVHPLGCSITRIEKMQMEHRYNFLINALYLRWLRVDRVWVDGVGDLAYYRDALDDQRDDQMTWLPYTPEILSYLPDVCRSDQHEWRVIAPLICMDIVEWHHPDRVMRQFGFKQCVPSSCDTSTKLHKIDRRGKLQFDYKQFHKEYVNLWETRLERVVEGEPLRGPMQYNDPYMVWYRKITRLFVSPFRQPSGRYQPRSLHFNMLTRGFAAIHARCQEKLVLTDDECPSEFRAFVGDISNFVAQTLDIIGQSYLIQDLATHSTSPTRATSNLHPQPPPPPSSPPPPSPPRSPSQPQTSISPPPAPSQPHPPPTCSSSIPIPQPTTSPPPLPANPLPPPPSNPPSPPSHHSPSPPQPTISHPFPPPVPPHPSPTCQPTTSPPPLLPPPGFLPQPTASSLPLNHIHIHLVFPPYFGLPPNYSIPTAYMSNSLTPPPSADQPAPATAPFSNPGFYMPTSSSVPISSFQPSPSAIPTHNHATYMTTSFTLPPSAYHLSSSPPPAPPQPAPPPPPVSVCPTHSPALSQPALSLHPSCTILQSTHLSASTSQRSKANGISDSEPCCTPSSDRTNEKSEIQVVRDSENFRKAKKPRV